MCDTPAAVQALIAKWRAEAVALRRSVRVADVNDYEYETFESQAHARETCADQLSAVLDGLTPEQDWQPIASAPKDGKPFIAANRFDAFRAFYDLEGEVWTAEDSGLWFGQMTHPPTHWIRLPPAVQREGEP